MTDVRLEVTEGPEGGTTGGVVVPPPLPPDDPEAWYAKKIQAQYEIHPGVVVTMTKRGGAFDYQIREPTLTEQDRQQLEEVKRHFADAHLERPQTRQGAAEVMEDGFAPKHERIVQRLVDGSTPTQRRISYHALASLACLGELTPYALDDRIEVADADESGLVVHTENYAPAATELPADPPFIERFASERLAQYTVSFHGFEIPVIRYRENVLGRDPFETKYAVREPDLLPGDEDLITECKERLWETSVDGIIEDKGTFVRQRAESILSRRLHRRNTRAWADALAYRVRSALAEYDLVVPPVERKFADDRLDDLIYYVLRDYVGYGQLTVPIRDPTLEDIEANRVDERIKVVPRDADAKRIPTNLRFEDEQTFVNVVTQLAASDGTELSSSTPSAKVNLSPPGIDETIRCAVALPTISENGPHISIRKQSADVLTPVDLVESGSLPTELVALLWLYYEHHGVVLFSGPTGVGKTTLMNAHMPFIRFEDRPISIDEGSREVRLPHETGVSLTTREHENEHKQVTMADLMTECNYLNPDIEVIAEVNTEESFETFAESINTGHGLIGTTHAGDIETLVNRIIEQGLPPYLLREIDLVIFPRRIDGERYVGEVVELLDERSYQQLDDTAISGVIEKRDTTIYWNTVIERDQTGEFSVAWDRDDGAETTFNRIGKLTDQPTDEVWAEFQRKHRYVKHMVQEGIDDFESIFELLADLQTNEAATVERLSRHATVAESDDEQSDSGDDR
ncbi:type II/IV secretion system ATPase subunit [Halovenus rubra]|uniref:Type II/IV secretion system ATPase subunit n=2 Tax=Halovenus rubra TaxID=869890 RepID=A0ABD5X966_9EURY|nr:type II/IV secretion system ATPase subunit [Halovenus rubra]